LREIDKSAIFCQGGVVRTRVRRFLAFILRWFSAYILHVLVLIIGLYEMRCRFDVRHLGK